MDSIFNILTTIKTDAESQLPSIILAAGLDAIDDYEIGQSRDAKKSAFLVYQGPVSLSYNQESFNAIYQLQLPRKSVGDIAKYTDAVIEWIKGYDSQRIGFTMYLQVLVETFPNEESESSFVFFEVFFIEQIDSCDSEDPD